MIVDEIIGGPFDGWTPAPEALLTRQECTDCRSRHLMWTPAARLVAAMAEVNEAQARDSFEMFLAVGAEPTSPAWACECGAFGVVAGVQAASCTPVLVGPNRAQRRAARRR